MARDGLPKPRLAHDAGEDDLGAVEGAVEAADEPQQPGRNVEVTLLSRFQHVVIGFALGADLRGHAVEALRGSLRSEEHTSELQSLIRISYAVFCLKKKKPKQT